MSRKEMIKGLGLFAFSAASMIILLNEPAKALDSGNSPDLPPDWADGMSQGQIEQVLQELEAEEQMKLNKQKL